MTYTPKSIINLIDKVAKLKYLHISPAKRPAYRAMLYAGVQCTINRVSQASVAAHIGYKESGCTKLVRKWKTLLAEHDSTATEVVAEFNRRFPQKAKSIEAIISARTQSSQTTELAPEDEVASPIVTSNVFGFAFTDSDEEMMQAAQRAAEEFMQSYGKGSLPRMHGEYYQPGTQPAPTDDTAKWLPTEAAAAYCGCPSTTLLDAALEGTINRRLYRRCGRHSYYEYNIEELDAFIANKGLV